MRRRGRLYRIRRKIAIRTRRLRRRLYRWWIRLMWVGVLVVGASIVVIAASVVAPQTAGVSTEGSPLAAGEEEPELTKSAVRANLLTELNEYRESKGRAPLERNDRIVDAAQSHADDMARKSYLAHEQPDGDTLQDRYGNSGVACGAGAENIAMTYYKTTIVRDDGSEDFYESPKELAQGIIRQWINSLGHRENMLGRDHFQVGHGVGIGTEDGETVVYVAQNFC